MADEKKITARETSTPPKQSFFAKDFSEIGKSLWNDRIIPGVKKFVYDVFTNGLHMSLFGNGVSTTTQSPYQQVSYHAYDQIYKPAQQYGAPKPPQPQQQSVLGYDRFVFDNRGDAEQVLLQMQDIIEEYGIVRVSDFYDIIQKTPPVTAHDWGWKSVVNAKVTVCSEGFCIQFPPVKPANK